MRFAYVVLAALPVLAGVPSFRATDAVTGLKMGYQLVVVDINKDGRKDLIAVDERSTELAWYENPGWTRHVLAESVPRVINLDAADLNGDGVPEIAMAHGFETNPEKSAGVVLLLESTGDPRARWKSREIDRVPTAHRLRWMRVDKRGAPALILAPLVGLASRAPSYSDKAPVFMYRAPDWKRETISTELNGILHSIAPVEWTGKGDWRLLTASFDGLSRLDPSRSGPWKRTELAKGDARPCPECGSSEIKMGRLGKRRFLAAIEPWHGSQVVVYAEDKRTVLDDTMINGHALAVGDLDGDGRDEIVTGFRGKGFRVTVYSADKSGEWIARVIDEGNVAAADCKIEDLNGDRKPDIACSGASTGNIRIFQQQ
jgi:hypothetical protein